MTTKTIAPTQPLQPTESAALVSSNASLPSIAELKQRMEWLAAFRPVLLEYVQRHMDPKRHMYTFADNKYTPLDVTTLQGMLTEGNKPALNQDGIHNLMSLYDCYPDEPTIHETREGGHYTCRASIRLMSFRSGLPMGAGTGSCSTRESKYAYRWVGKRNLPQGLDPTALRQREGRYGTSYRIDNEDTADVESTVLQMAVKRAKSAAVKALPLVSEMFTTIGDPDEEKRVEDETRQALLQPIGAWLRAIKSASARAKAIVAVFGEPLRPEDLAKLDEDQLATAWQIVEIANKASIAWESPTLLADLKAILARSAQQAKEDLFGDHSPTASTPTAPPARDDTPQTAEDAPQSTNAPKEVVGEQDKRRGPRDAPSAPQGIWREQLASLAADLLGRLDEGLVNGGLAQRTKDATQKAERLPGGPGGKADGWV